MRHGVAVTGVVLALAGCGKGARGEPGPIDVATGTFRGVGTGNTTERMGAVLGLMSPASGDDRISPTGAPDLHDGPVHFRGGSVFHRYDGATFFVERNGRIAYLMVTAPGSKTERGVAIGDELARARAAYPELGCGTANGGRTTAHTRRASPSSHRSVGSGSAAIQSPTSRWGRTSLSGLLRASGP